MYEACLKPNIFISTLSANSVYWHLHDTPHVSKPNKSQKVLERYITVAEHIFEEKTTVLSNFTKAFTLDEERSLRAMLELLIDARKIWEDEA